MPRVNTASVREEIAHVEEELDRLSAADKVSDESRVLFNTLLMIINLRVSVFLEKTTRKTSQNSSKPSSQTDTDTSAASARTQGKGPTEHETAFAISRTVETRIVADVNRCRRFNLPAMIERFTYVAMRTPPMPYRLLKMAEP